MITKDLLFNDKSLNIFTDGSITKINGETIGSAGSILIYNDNILDEKYEIIRNSTNNITEITAIRLGILQALKYRNDNIKHINLFSDSQLCIYGLREWIFNWINCLDKNIMYNSSGNPVANQSIFLDIIYTILNNNLRINLYHVRGHRPNTAKGILEFKESFKKINFVRNEIDDNLIRELIKYNDYIDVYTGITLENLDLSLYPELINPINYICNNINVVRYKELLGLK